MGAFSKIRVAFKKYPLLRGMASYGVIWPISSLIQQTFEGKNLGKQHLHTILSLQQFRYIKYL